jgi:hypothetical protein
MEACSVIAKYRDDSFPWMLFMPAIRAAQQKN